LDEFETVFATEFQVERDQIGNVYCQSRGEFVSVPGFRHSKAFEFEALAQQRTYRLFVIDDQNVLGVRGPRHRSGFLPLLYYTISQSVTMASHR
jgi:hypothetical protein